MTVTTRLCLIPLVAGTLLSACINPLTRDGRNKIDKQTTFAEVTEDPSAFLDRYLLLGGVVVSVENDAAVSVLEVMEWRLSPWGEPLAPDDSGQRFLVRSSGPFDMELFEPGRLVTLFGKVLCSETRPLGEQPYRYPVFALDEIYVWESPFRYGIHPHPDPQFPYLCRPGSLRPQPSL